MIRDAISVRNASLSLPTNRSLILPSKAEILKNISLEVQQGETLGVIGGNGSGKSTLLKLLAGIYKPDSGDVVRYTKSTSLLSLTAGFDENLSGRDNALISSMFLGRTKKSALEAIDKIREFSALGEQFEKPVKTYSSGMLARLGFSIAIKMRADVILVDEIIGVGDASFREKAEKSLLDKMNSSQTFVLVSHSLDQIKRLCNRTVWLDQGQIMGFGNTGHVLSQYESFVEHYKAY